MADMLRADLKLADIPFKDDAGCVFDFHALRHQTGTLHSMAGTSPKVTQILMRHSDIRLTMDTYTHRIREAEHDAVERLPDLPMESVKEPRKATGTDDAVPGDGDSVLASCWAPNQHFRDNSGDPGRLKRGSSRDTQPLMRQGKTRFSRGKTQSHLGDLNPGPMLYESIALPLS